MKTYLIIFILALCFTCWVTDVGMPPMDQPLGIKDISAGAAAANKQESMIPDFRFTEEAKDSSYIIKIDETNSGKEADFPWGAPR